MIKIKKKTIYIFRFTKALSEECRFVLCRCLNCAIYIYSFPFCSVLVKRNQISSPTSISLLNNNYFPPGCMNAVMPKSKLYSCKYCIMLLVSDVLQYIPITSLFDHLVQLLDLFFKSGFSYRRNILLTRFRILSNKKKTCPKINL